MNPKRRRGYQKICKGNKRGFSSTTIKADKNGEVHTHRWSALSVVNREMIGKYPLSHEWIRITYKAVHNDKKIAQSHSFINDTQPVIENREELEDFLKRNPTVPHDRQTLFDNCDSKNPKIIPRDDLVAMYED